ncbi:glucosaminidase domain-containing protein [Neobacillus muris]|uniref:glucosaminidase domain-containing protein n=1 Tax=Neobacillus muris TaxID=2941334 RepID=UPI00204154EA|nr:glucosaminidase domain-containing protein [Neobacillus muris]
MNIGDDWFTKTMLVSTLSRSGMGSQLAAVNAGTENTFTKLLSQLLLEVESQSSDPSDTTSFVPEYTDSINPFVTDQTMPFSTNEPLSYQDRSTDQLNQGLAGKLSGMGDVFIRAGKQYNLDPALLAAIAKHESANGKSMAASVKNNIAGMMGKNGLKTYESVEASIMDMARNLSKNYLAQGLTSIAQIGAKYAPVGAANDPTGLNNHWVAGVTKFFEQLKV